MTPRFSEPRASQAAALLLKLAGGSMSVLSLIKLLYFADRRALLELGRPITFDWYYSLPHGPVLSFTLNLVNRDIEDEDCQYWGSLISERSGHTVSLLKPEPPMDQLSEKEEDIVRDVFGEFGGLPAWQLREISHRLPEWEDPQGSRIPITLEKILRGAGKEESEIEAILGDLSNEASISEL